MAAATRRAFASMVSPRISTPVSTMAAESTRAAALSIQKHQQQIEHEQQKRSIVSPELIDTFGRKHSYLRISLTERCNLRCTYCMPEKGVDLQAQSEILNNEEVLRISKLFVSLGVRKIRLTGGEPLLRRDFVKLCEDLGALPGLDNLAITTNAITLEQKQPSRSFGPVLTRSPRGNQNSNAFQRPAIAHQGFGFNNNNMNINNSRAFSTSSTPDNDNTSAAAVPAVSADQLTHVDSKTGRPMMVDVGHKEVTRRSARARTVVVFPPDVAKALQAGGGELQSSKGPVLATAIVAGVMGAKRTSELIPFCHPLPIDTCNVNMSFDPTDACRLYVDCTVKTTHKTGVEMEALTGASIAALVVYDMCKALSHDIVIAETKLMSKSGGKRLFERKEES